MAYSKVEEYPQKGTYEEDHIAKRDALDKFLATPTMEKVQRVREHLKDIEQNGKRNNYCSVCKAMTDTKQVERDETCLEVCSVCDKEYDLPF